MQIYNRQTRTCRQGCNTLSWAVSVTIHWRNIAEKVVPQSTRIPDKHQVIAQSLFISYHSPINNLLAHPIITTITTLLKLAFEYG